MPPKMPLGGGGDRDDGLVVLVGAAGRRAAPTVEHADDGQRHAVDVHRLTDRVAGRRRARDAVVEPSTATSARVGHVGRRSMNRPSADRAGPGPTATTAWCRPREVVQLVVAGDQRSSDAATVGGDRRDVGGDRLRGERVGVRQRSGWTRTRSRRRTRRCWSVLPGRDDEQVGAERVDLGLDLRLRALAQPDGEDHRGDADEDAEHGERRAQPVRADRLAARCASVSSQLIGAAAGPVESSDDQAVADAG